MPARAPNTLVPLDQLVISPEEVFVVEHPYESPATAIVRFRLPAPAPSAPQQRIPLGPPGTDRCDQPQFLTLAELPDEGSITLTLLGPSGACVVNARDNVALGNPYWLRGVRVSSENCIASKWAIVGSHPRIALLETTETEFFGRERVTELPAEEQTILANTTESAAILVLRAPSFPYEVFELWRNASPRDGVRIRQQGTLLRALPERPRAFLRENERYRAIVFDRGSFRSVLL